jgi:hypothetical protein
MLALPSLYLTKRMLKVPLRHHCGLLPSLSYSVFMPKPSTHRMHGPGSIVPHIRLRVFTDNQMSRIKYNYYISSVSKDYDDS